MSSNDPKNKNPSGLTNQQVLNGLREGIYHLGKVPASEKATAPYWNTIIFFVFDDAEKPVTNWYGCAKCDWVANTIREGGTGVLKNNVKRHDTQLYRLTRAQIVELLHQTSIYGDVYGAISVETFSKLLPSAKGEW